MLLIKFIHFLKVSEWLYCIVLCILSPQDSQECVALHTSWSDPFWGYMWLCCQPKARRFKCIYVLIFNISDPKCQNSSFSSYILLKVSTKQGSHYSILQIFKRNQGHPYLNRHFPVFKGKIIEIDCLDSWIKDYIRLSVVGQWLVCVVCDYTLWVRTCVCICY